MPQQIHGGAAPAARPQFGIQGPVVAFWDPWEGEASDTIIRTGTGIPIPSQDPPPTPEEFVAELKRLGADFYVHHVVPTSAEVHTLLRDLDAADVDLVVGNEYGNINGPYVEGTNRFDIPSQLVGDAAASGRLVGVLYDEPEHLQIHADQYRKDDHLPHFGHTDGQTAEAAIATIDQAARSIVADVSASARGAARPVSVVAEHVFPVMFHTLARAGMTPCPKVMKESFQPLQMATALGAAVQYGRDLWICADLWGPDIGPWFTRAPGFPGHSPAEFASALRMAYLFAPTRLFVESIDVLVRHTNDRGFLATEHGEVWLEFLRDFVPANPLRWSYRDARPDIALVHAEDSDFGRGQRPFGNRRAIAPETSRSIFDAWHRLSHGQIPSHGSCLHIPGYEFPRHRLNDMRRDEFPLEAATPRATTLHGLFQPMPNVLAFDEHVGEQQLDGVGLIVAVGSRIPRATVERLRARAEAGATVAIGSWLAPTEHRRNERAGDGVWLTFDSLDDPHVQEHVEPRLGPADRWTQRFGDTEVRIFPKDPDGQELVFEIADVSSSGHASSRRASR